MTDRYTQLGLSRRQLIIGTGAVALSGGVPNFWRPATAQTLFESGNKKVRSISDGNLVLPVSFLFPDIARDKLEEFFAANGMNTQSLAPECNLTLVEDGERTILFDAGSGANFMPSAGKLPATLEAAGIDPTSITDVIFTHGHPDHLWGIIDDFDEIAFPDAALYFPRVEWDFWRAEDTINKMSEGRQSFAIGAKNRFEAMQERVQLFDAGVEVLSGIEAVDTAGHTPGHMAFAIHGDIGGDSLMVVGDALTNHAVSFQKPEWPSGSDQVPDMGIKSRLSLLDRLANEKMPLIGYHLPNGGLGRVERKDSAYQFVQAL